MIHALARRVGNAWITPDHATACSPRPVDRGSRGRASAGGRRIHARPAASWAVVGDIVRPLSLALVCATHRERPEARCRPPAVATLLAGARLRLRSSEHVPLRRTRASPSRSSADVRCAGTVRWEPDGDALVGGVVKCRIVGGACTTHLLKRGYNTRRGYDAGRAIVIRSASVRTVPSASSSVVVWFGDPPIRSGSLPSHCVGTYSTSTCRRCG
jgi:hypothetical protein